MSSRPRQGKPPREVAAGRRARWPWLLAFAAPALVVSALIVGRQSRPAAVHVRDNLLLVTLDTTRADRLGCYGHAEAGTRYLDRLAAEGARFEQALSPAPITLPAHASIFTALYPIAHGVRNNGNFSLSDRHATLATILKA